MSLFATFVLLSGPLMFDWAEAATPTADLHHYYGRSRILLVFAPQDEDPSLLRQRAIVKDSQAGFQDRQLVFVAVISTSESALRHRFGIAANSFRAILIGKDGGPKLQSSSPLSAEQLFAAIDAMPMRRLEMERK